MRIWRVVACSMVALTAATACADVGDDLARPQRSLELAPQVADTASSQVGATGASDPPPSTTAIPATTATTAPPTTAVTTAGTEPPPSVPPTVPGTEASVPPPDDAVTLPVPLPSGDTVAEAESDAAALVLAFNVVVDLDVPFERRALHLESADLLRPSVEEYVRRVRPYASQIGVRLADLVIDGDRATFTYDLVTPDETVLLASLAGDAYLSNDMWVVTKVSFCSTVARIGIGCPI